MKRLVVVGGKGSAEIAMTIFEAANAIKQEWKLEGFLCDDPGPGEMLGKYPVLDVTAATPDYVNKGYYIHYALQFNAKKKFERVQQFLKYNVPLEANATAIHPSVILAPETKIGYGCVVCANAASSYGATLGNFSHIYTAGFLGHDCTTEDFVTIAAHSIIGARVKVSEGAHVGLNSCIREDISVGRYAIIGMGSVVVKNVDNYSVVAGNPARFLKTLDIKEG